VRLGAQANPPDRILSGCEVDYPPFCVVQEDGRADGFSVSLMREALEKMGRTVEFRTGTWAEVRGRLERGEIHALPLVGRTPERETAFDFTVPYLTLHGPLWCVDSSGINGFEDLRGKRVGVMRGTTRRSSCSGGFWHWPDHDADLLRRLPAAGHKRL
jgi:two-component system sensor histidine kinase EvgS